MRYALEPRESIYVKAYRFSFFAKNMGMHLSKKYSQKLLNSTKKYTADAIKTVSKKVIKKTAEVTGDLVCNKIAN